MVGTRRRIEGSAGSAPQAPAPHPAPAGGSEPIARLVERSGAVYVEVEGRRLRLADQDLARLRDGAAAAAKAAKAIPAELAHAMEAAQINRQALMALPHVVSVRGGYKFVGGRITKTPAVVVAVDRKVDGLPEHQRVPEFLPDGTPTDVAVADPFDRLERTEALAEAVPGRQPLLIEQIQPGVMEAVLLEAVPIITYEPPPGASLDPVTGAMSITCHVSPDAGWKVLRPFLEGAKEEVVLGMYDFTAPHIYRAVRSLLRDSEIEWRQTLGPKESLPGAGEVDSTKAEDKPEASIIRGLKRVAQGRFKSAFAHVGAGQTFASAYHIKVAVRDQEAIWLSSGNWQSSNQPSIDFLDPTADRKLIPSYNREWHVVIENPDLARTFRQYLLHDLETAEETPEVGLEAAPVVLPDVLMPADELLAEERATLGLEVFQPRTFDFGDRKPLTVQPILTPDNYADIVLDLIRRRPKKTLYFQNQSLNPVLSPTPRWAELLQLLADYTQDGSLDVRIIFRNIGPIRKKLESLQAAGFDMERVRVQSGCHTKGIVIDSKTVLLGSHNWTNEGIEANRDASLLIRNAAIARYYEQVFLHDWERLAKPSIREEATPILIEPGTESVAAGDLAYQRVPWSSWLEE